jgi:hypothetical protein
MSDMRVATTSGAVVDEATIQSFSSNLRGELLRSGGDSYEAARKVFNGMIDKRPALIARCAGAADVIHAVNFARSNGLLVAVRGGGHSVAGKSVCDGGLLIDLSLMKGLRIDSMRRTARAQPGLRLGDFDRETQAFGLATTLGIVSDTGIAGLTLGGGLGWLNGKYGLACDNLLSADVVTADGRLLTASANENSDLFWGLRGGGGNFGVVTSFEYQLHPVDTVFGGMALYPFAKAKEVLRFYLDFSAECPDELTTALALLTGPDGSPLVAFVVCHCGTIRDGEKETQPVRAFGPPLVDEIKPMPYLALQSIIDGAFPPGRQHYWKSGFTRELSADGIEIMVDFMARKPSPFTVCYLQQLHGAAARVSPADTAFPHRAEQYDFAILSQWDDPAASEQNVTWTQSFFGAMQPHLEKAVYVNSLGEEGEERVKAAYGPNYDQLVALKNKYDPTNFFHLNQNIKPAVG